MTNTPTTVRPRPWPGAGRHLARLRGTASFALGLSATLWASPALTSPGPWQEGAASGGSKSLEETRLTLGKWIETEQIISKERNDWQQGKEILVGRVDLLKQEIASLEQKIAEAQTAATAAEQKRAELAAEGGELKAVGAEVMEGVRRLEAQVRRVLPMLPEPIRQKVQPLVERMPADPESDRPTFPERYQNVIGILNELNKANNEITVNFEVHTLADGKPSEVRAIYVGLAQAYYVSAAGEAGIGRPSADGWQWEPSKAVSEDVVVVLEILQGKHSPAFVPLPVKLQ